jgi:hypothetical protein
METRKLYDILLLRINADKGKTDRVLSVQICNKIKKKLPLEYSEALLGLIYRHYELNHAKKKLEEDDYISPASKKDNTLNLPYKIKTYSNGKVPQVAGEKLPVGLINIIVEYINYIESK